MSIRCKRSTDLVNRFIEVSAALARAWLITQPILSRLWMHCFGYSLFHTWSTDQEVSVICFSYNGLFMVVRLYSIYPTKVWFRGYSRLWGIYKDFIIYFKWLGHLLKLWACSLHFSTSWKLSVIFVPHIRCLTSSWDRTLSFLIIFPFFNDFCKRIVVLYSEALM